MDRVIRWILGHSKTVVLVCGLFAVLGGYFAFHLYSQLRTDLGELLPREARSVRDLEEIQRRLRSNSNLAVLAFSKNREASRRFVEDLARAIQEENSPAIERIEYRIKREIEFFQKREALFLDLADLRKIRNYVRDRIDYERSIRNPLNIFSGADIPEPVLDFESLQRRYSGRVSAYTRFKDGYYANQDGTIRVILVYASGSSSDVEVAKTIRSTLDRLIRDLRPRSYSEDLVVKYAGDVANLVEEHEALIGDLAFSTVVVFILCGVAILFYYRSLVGSAALIASLLIGTAWTFGVSWFAVGYLNANSAFMGAIVLGNGINFGIIYLARYLEERRKGVDPPVAASIAVLRTRGATFAAALAAGVAYGSLVLTGFRGFRQFGVIGLIGMVFCWIAAYTALPAMLVWIERILPAFSRPSAPRKHRTMGVLARMVTRWSIPLLLVSGGLLALSVVAAIRFPNVHGGLIQTDTTKLRDKRSMTRGSGYNERYLDEVFGRYISPMVALTRSVSEAGKVRSRLMDRKSRTEGGHFIKAVYSIHDVVPSRQEQKIALLREIQGYLTPEIVAKMSASDRARVRRVLRPESFRAFGAKDLPPSVRLRFQEKDGRVGRVVLIEPVLDPIALRDGDNQLRLMNAIRSGLDSVRPGIPVAGQLPLMVDMYEAIRRDGPRATLFAFLGVVLVVVVLFRGVRMVFLSLIGLLLGVAWLAGLLFFWDLKINFLNFIALPITFGIGVDYAVNILQRYRSERPRDISAAVQGTGGAVILASLTTVIGYGSLMMAGNQAFVSFGRIAILGELTCLSAALVALPAWISLLDRRAPERNLQEPLAAPSAERKVS